MEILTKYFTESSIHLYPIGDIHIGDKCFGKESRRKLHGYINWIRATPNAYAVLTGDILNVATKDSTTSPFAQDMDLEDQINAAVGYFDPIKHKVLGAIDGNHEQRLSRYCGYSPTISICERLNIPYLKSSAVIVFRLGCHNSLNQKNKLSNKSRASFVGYFHHTTGGGGTIGGKINRVAKLREIVADADFYCGSHNHALAVSPNDVRIVDRVFGKIETLRQMLVDCGGYLEWNNSYAEDKQMAPLKIGSPRINLFIKRKKFKNELGKYEEEVIKDIHVSI